MKVYEVMSRVVVGRGETIHCIRLNPDGGKVEESRISDKGKASEGARVTETVPLLIRPACGGPPSPRGRH